MDKSKEIYVVQGRSGIIFTVTTDYEKAKEVNDSINNSDSAKYGERSQLSHWINGKCIFKE